MKKIISVLILATLLPLAGCSVDQYAIERQYYQAKKQAEKIFKNPHATPPNELERVVTLLNGFPTKYPQSRLALDAGFTIAGLYTITEEYEQARAQLNKMLTAYSKAPAICAEVMFRQGNTFELENKWDSALAQYKKTIRQYALTVRGLELPVYIAQYYKVKFQPDKMMEAFREAISHYNTLVQEYSGSPLAYKCQTVIAQCYLAMKEWQSAIDTFESIIKNYKRKIRKDSTLFTVSALYSRQLKDNVRAREALERLIAEYPKSKLVGPAQAVIKKLTEAKK